MLREENSGICLKVKVIPKASKSEVVGWENDELRIRIAGIPEKGEANDTLINFLSKNLKISKSNIQIIQGEKSRHKQLLINNISLKELKIRFLNAFNA